VGLADGLGLAATAAMVGARLAATTGVGFAAAVGTGVDALGGG
jgi:hypothetical protein